MARDKYPALLPPPRGLSLTTRLMLLFIGGKNFKTWFIFGLTGFLFFTVMRSHGKSYLFPFLPKTTKKAFVVHQEPDDQHQLVTYQFYTDQGGMVESFSYLPKKVQIEQEMVVQHSTHFPAIAELQGYQNPFYVQLSLIIIVSSFLLSLFFITLLLLQRSKELKLLKRGKITYGGLTSQKTVHNNQQQLQAYELQFAYLVPETGDRVHRLTTQTLEITDITDDPVEAILYMPQQPEKATLFDALPGDLSINHSGKIVSDRSIADPLGVMILAFSLPVVGYILNLAYPIFDFISMVLEALLDG